MPALPSSHVRATVAVLVAALVATATLPAAAVAGPTVIGGANASAATPVTTCTTIDSPGTYALESDLRAADGSCLVVRADGVTVRGNGHGITAASGAGSNTSAAAVRAVGVDGVAVEDVVVSGWQTGVALRDTREAAVRNATMRQVRTGVAVTDSRSVVVAGNTVTHAVHGVVAEGSGGVTVRDNVVRDPRSTAIRLADGVLPVPSDSPFGAEGFGATTPGDWPFDRQVETAHRVANNTVVGGFDYGILVVGQTAATVAGNEVADTEDGIYLRGTSGVTVRGNVVTGSGDDGIAVANGSENVLRRNRVRASGDDGVYVVGNANRVANNTVLGAGDDGIDLHYGSHNTLADNRVRDSADNGIYLRNADENTVAGNAVLSNEGDGIDLRRSSRNVLRENRFCRNGMAWVNERPLAHHNALRNNSVC